MDGVVLSIKLNFEKKRQQHFGLQKCAKCAPDAHFKSAISSAHLECPLTSGQLGRYFTQCCDVTALQMRISEDADLELSHFGFSGGRCHRFQLSHSLSLPSPHLPCSCWLRLDTNFIWSFIGPATLIIMVSATPGQRARSLTPLSLRVAS